MESRGSTRECVTLQAAMNIRQSPLLLLWLSVLGTGAPAARPAESPGGRVVVATAAVSMDQAVRMAEQRFHARVVKAETQSDNGHTVYVLKLLNDSGKVWTVRVDAANGSVQ